MLLYDGVTPSCSDYIKSCSIFVTNISCVAFFCGITLNAAKKCGLFGFSLFRISIEI